MKFDAVKKAKVEISQNDYVENRVSSEIVKAKEEKVKKSKLDFLDAAIVATGVGGLASLGYLCYTVAKLVGGASVLTGALASLGII